MKKLIVVGLAALAIGLAAAPVAGADANDREFIKATDRPSPAVPAAAATRSRG